MNTFPFSALVGQELLKKGLLVNAVDPSIGGVLLRGEKGTGKTTAVRSFAAVLPPKEVASGCRFGCVRGTLLCDECRAREASGEVLRYEPRAVEVVDLALNASEDRVVGSLDLEAALRDGSRKFEMGVLGKANGNVLYIDEVNLLDDHVVDVLLDVAVSGVNVVMREGVSYRHPSRFLLVGTMNPEEGELRPQLLDRFGLCVEISGERDVGLRKSIVERVLLFEGEDAGFREKWDRKDEELRIVVRDARARLEGVYVADSLLKMVAEVNVTLGIAGHRGDLAILKSARALAALRGGVELSAADLRDAIRLALPHRVPRSGVNAARAHHVERLLSWAFPGKMEEEEDGEPVVPLPGTAHGMKRGGVIFRAPTIPPEEQERQAISQAMAARHRYEAAETAARQAEAAGVRRPGVRLLPGVHRGKRHHPVGAVRGAQDRRPEGAQTLRRGREAEHVAHEKLPRPVRPQRSVGKGAGHRARRHALRRRRGGARPPRDPAHADHSFRPARKAAGAEGRQPRARRDGRLRVDGDAAADGGDEGGRAVAAAGLLRQAGPRRPHLLPRHGGRGGRSAHGERVAGGDAAHLARLGGTTPLSIGLFAAVKTLELEKVREPSRKSILAPHHRRPRERLVLRRRAAGGGGENREDDPEDGGHRARHRRRPDGGRARGAALRDGGDAEKRQDPRDLLRRAGADGVRRDGGEILFPGGDEPFGDPEGDPQPDGAMTAG